MKTKICTECKLGKPLNCFSIRSGKDYLHTQCDDCRREYKLNYDLAHKEEKNRKSKEYYQNTKQAKKEYAEENKERISKYQKEYKAEHKDEQKEYNEKYQKEYARNNREKINNRRKKYRDENKERIRNYYIENAEKISLYNKEYKQNNKQRRNENDKIKKKLDPEYKLRSFISSSIYAALKNNGYSKEGKSSWKSLPYSPAELREHIESLFEPWMNWNNQGKWDKNTWDDNDPLTWKWQLDHIIPHSLFQYKLGDDNFLKCWGLNNLRPLSAKQNSLDGSNRSRHKSQDI